MTKINYAQSNRIALLLLAWAASLASASSYAQSSQPALEELVVTAQRRTTDLQNASIAASVISGDLLEDKNIDNLEFLQYTAPNVKINHYGSANVFTIRGIGRTQVDIDVPSGVVIYRDGAPTIAGYFQGEPYYDLKSVEVLRGPQGTFVGKSASGGAVFINTMDPEFGEEITGSVEAGYGSDDMKEFTGIFNIPINDTLAIRGGYKHLDSNDYFESIGGDNNGGLGERDMDSYRLGIRWAPNDKFEAKVKMDHHDLDFGGNPIHQFGEDPLNPINEGDITYEDKSTRLVVDLGYQFNNGYSVRSLSAYQYLDSINNLDLNGGNRSFNLFKSAFDVEIWTQEVNIVSPEEDRFRWIGGFLFFQQEADLFEPEENGFIFFNADVAAGIDYPWLASPWYKHEDEWSVFGHVAYDITDRLEAEAGVRYSDYYTYQVTNYVLGDGLSPPTIPFLPATPGYVKQDIDETSLDWQIALNYTFSYQHFVYALASRGHTTGSNNILPPFGEYDEMVVFNYEAGWKANWINDQIRTQANFFYQDLDDYIVNYELVVFNALPGPFHRNHTGEPYITGIELASQAHINDWHVDFNFSYSWSSLGKAENLLDPLTGQIVDRSGIDLPFLSPLTTNVGIAYDFRIGDEYTLTPRFDVSYSDGYQTKLWDCSCLSIEDRTLANINIALRPDSDKWLATFWMTNAFDETYVSAIQNVATMRYTGRPREFGVRLKYNF